jgi:ketosteroid isomerase-like protein
MYSWRSASLVLAAALCLVPLVGAAQHGHAPPAGALASSPDQQQVRATLEALFRAVEAGDMTALDTLYAGDSLTVVEGAGINRGWTDYRDHHLAPELREMSGFQYRPADIEAHVSGDLAWALFRYTIRGRAEERALDLVGRGTAILERRGNRWIVRHTHTASRARRPNDPA